MLYSDLKRKNETDTSSLAGDLSDVSLELSPNDIKDVCSQWKSSLTSIDLSSIDVESAFSSLVSVGVATSYIPSLKQALSKGEKSTLATINMINTVANEQSGIDQQYNSRQNGGIRSGSDNTGGGGGCPPTSSGVTATPAALDDELAVEDPVTEEELVINDEFVDDIKKLNSDSYIELMKYLGNIDGGLLPYLVDTEYASKLKEYLLASPNLSEDLKKKIMEMDENELQVTLLSIVTDESAISDVSKSIIYKYTELLSSKEGLEGFKQSDLFLQNVDRLDEVLEATYTSENVQESLLKIYDGDVEELDENLVQFLRSAVDEFCESKNIDYETLLTDSSKSEEVKEYLADLSKTLSYFKAVNSLGSEAAELLYSSLITPNVGK